MVTAYTSAKLHIRILIHIRQVNLFAAFFGDQRMEGFRENFGFRGSEHGNLSLKNFEFGPN